MKVTFFISNSGKIKMAHLTLSDVEHFTCDIRDFNCKPGELELVTSNTTSDDYSKELWKTMVDEVSNGYGALAVLDAEVVRSEPNFLLSTVITHPLLPELIALAKSPGKTS
jgi:hypothetical protein